MIIPTFNRPKQLKALLHHLRRQGADFLVIVLDSSASEHIRFNETNIRYCGLSVEHRVMPVGTEPRRKFEFAFYAAKTTYASLCPDDDVVFVGAIRASVAALAADSRAVTCDGRYLSFGRGGVQVEYDAPAIDGSPLERIWKRLARYEPSVYAVWRRTVACGAFSSALRFESDMFWEVFLGLYPLIHGRHLRLPVDYMARATGPLMEDMPRQRWHPYMWAKTDPEDMMRHFIIYLGMLSNEAKLHPARLMAAHVRFFRNERVDLGQKFTIRDPTVLGRLYRSAFLRWRALKGPIRSPALEEYRAAL